MKIENIFTIGVLLSVSQLAVAGPIPHFELRTSFEQADIVVVGQVNSVASAGSKIVTGQEQVVGQEKRAFVSVLEQLKGPITPAEIEVDFAFPDGPSDAGNITPGTRLLFLKAHGGRYQVADPYYPSVPAQPNAEGQSEAPLQRAAVAIASFVRNPSADPAEKVLALSALEGGRYPRALELIRPTTMDTTAVVQIGALVDLLEAGDGGALQQAGSLLLRPSISVPPYLLHNLSFAISVGRFASGNTEALAALLKAPETETRRAAAQALWHSSDPTALKSLSSAMADTDRDVRYYAVRGLAELANQPDWAPSIPEFESKEDLYLQHWKEWADQRQGR